VTYGGACSLDGYIAGPDGSFDWLHWSKDAQRIMAEYWRGIDTLVMGRKTWEVAAAMGGGMRGVTAYVFSRTLAEITHPDVHLVREDPGEFVRELKQRDGGGICVFGGGELAATLFAADVIDEVGLNIHPILLGSGIPFVRDPGRRISLELAECRPIEGGCVYVMYRVGPRTDADASTTRRRTRRALRPKD
jgi:dihydrofolate reductase